MSLYARSDVMSVSVPVSSGGCGNSHSRPVNHGSPARIFELSCPRCESYLRGTGRPKVIRATKYNAQTGAVAGIDHVPDSDPMWSSTPETIPLTPDETQTKHLVLERGEQQLRALESVRVLKDSGVDLSGRPDILYFLQERGVPSDVLQGQIVCLDGHLNMAGTKFCGECGIPLSTQAALEAAPEPEPEMITDFPLDMLTYSTLKQRCREQGLSMRGNKEALIGRLEAARRRAA